MKRLFFLLIVSVSIIACHQEADFRNNAEVTERMGILKSGIAELPPDVPIRFYWIRGNLDSLTLATSCPAADVRFDAPYLLVNGIRFNVSDWQSTQNYADGRKIGSSAIRFWHR